MEMRRYNLAVLGISKTHWTHEQMQMKTASVAAVSASVGLSIHKGKTKVLKFKAENNNPITIDGETLENVESFTYLGSIIDEQGGSDADVKARIGKARTAFLQLKNIDHRGRYENDELQLDGARKDCPGQDELC
ncbi:unnamed protein product [Schistosoma margrebowiei]|uniref:Uncharacterized protein n=1 Tax=Schistosoma margrebowiei TaxID=48269 RepID=A0A183N7T4_9TREM|nr:unnamed protein product [Schistosoma margrebowiei]